MSDDQINHYPDGRLLSLVHALGGEIELTAFKDGGLTLKGLTAKQMKLLFGMDDDENVSDRGFRFDNEIIKEDYVSSTPFFGGRSPLLDNQDIDQNLTGQIKIKVGQEETSLSLVIDKVEDHYSVEIIPSVSMDSEFFLNYLAFISTHLK